jgi:hypothetical protein
MGMTATELGRELGIGAREVNKLLKFHGFMEGDPGAYRPTALGRTFAVAHDFDNGYGGFAHRQWGWLSWKDGLVDALKASVKANPDGVVPTASAPSAVVTKVGQAAPGTGSGVVGKFVNKKGLAAVAVVVVVASAPAVTDAWHKKVKPAASKVQARIVERRSAKGSAGVAEPGSGQ